MNKILHYITLGICCLFLPFFASAQLDLIKVDTVYVQSPTATGLQSVCIPDVFPENIVNYKIEINDQTYFGELYPCSFERLQYTFAQPYATGVGSVILKANDPFTIENWVANGKTFSGSFNSIQALKDSMKVWDKPVDWTLDSARYIIKRPQGIGQYYGTIRMSAGKLKYNALPSYITTQPGFLLLLPVGLHKLTLTQPITGLKENVYILIAHTSPSTVSKDIKLNETAGASYCLDFSQLQTKPYSVKISNLKNKQPNAEIALNSDKTCVQYVPKAVGRDTVTLVSCVKNICDTTTLIVNVLPSANNNTKKVLNENVVVNQTKTILLPTTGLSDNIKSITNVCPSRSGRNVAFTNTDNIITFKGLSVGVDTACYVICDDKNACDTTMLIVNTTIPSACDFIAIDTIRTISKTCSGTVLACFSGISEDLMKTYSIKVGKANYTQNIIGCDFDTARSYNFNAVLLSVSSFTLVDWKVNNVAHSGTFSNTTMLKDSMNRWDPFGSWEVLVNGSRIRGGTAKNTYSSMNFKYTITNPPPTREGTYTAVASEVFIAKSAQLILPVGKNVVYITDTQKNCTDSVVVITPCVTTQHINISINTGNNGRLGLDFSELGSAPVSVTVIKQPSKGFVNMSLSEGKAFVNYVGTKSGKDTAILVFCDKFKICDTTYIYFNVKNQIGVHRITDATNVGFTKTQTIDTSVFSNPIDANSFQNFCAKSTNKVVDFVLNKSNYSIQYTPLKVGKDTACIRLCDNQNKCDTTYLYIEGLPIQTNSVINDVVNVGKTKEICIEVDAFQLPTDSVTITNICPAEKGQVDFQIKKSTTCKGANQTGHVLVYTGNAVGNGAACIVVDNNKGKKDTIRYQIRTENNIEVVVNDTLFLNQSQKYCIDTTGLKLKTGWEIENNCSSLSGDKVKFAHNINDKCDKGFNVSADALAVGQNSACFIIKQGENIVKSYRYNVTVLKPIKKIITDNVLINNEKRFCIDTTELSGTVTKIENYCKGNSGKNVTIVEEFSTRCFKATGKAIGLDTVCIVACDKFNTCDTTQYILNVINNGSPPSAIDDTISTTKGRMVNIAILNNDTTTRTDSSWVSIIGNGGANNGAVIKNTDKTTITYIPDFDFCGIDSFKYILCNLIACDTATVFVTIKCEDLPESDSLIVYTALSPNGDGINDNFVIRGLQLYPDHTVCIFNRWGNQVLLKKNYNNDWKGTWEDADLPDGTYFYILNDKDGKRIKSGYLQLHR